MKLAKLESKAKALVGTQYWRGLDPEAVLKVCATLAKARERHRDGPSSMGRIEGAIMISDYELKRMRDKTANPPNPDYPTFTVGALLDEVERLRVKHTKVHAAIVDARACYIQTPNQRRSVIAQIDEILVKALKEIDE